MADNKEIVVSTMQKAGKALKAGEIVELTGLGKKDVDKAMKELKKDDAITSPKRCYWEPVS